MLEGMKNWPRGFNVNVLIAERVNWILELDFLISYKIRVIFLNKQVICYSTNNRYN